MQTSPVEMTKTFTYVVKLNETSQETDVWGATDGYYIKSVHTSKQVVGPMTQLVIKI